MDDVRQFPPGRGLIEAPGLPLQRFQADLTEYDTYLRRVADGINATNRHDAFTAPLLVEGDDVEWGKAS